jgi:GH24 family phage-related lysozyme (muramidase)
MSVLSRWQTKRTGRHTLRARARASVVYWGRRAGSSHGKAILREARARLALRNQQVAEADRVIARHRNVFSMSNAGVALVASFEGFSARAYRDPVGVLTQGYGETQGVTPGKAWSKAYALTRLRARLNRDYLAPVLALAKAIDLDLAQHQADALGSLVYNLGPGILEPGHTMGEALRSKSHRGIADAFLPYDKAGGRALPGLTRRRKAERALYLKA